MSDDITIKGAEDFYRLSKALKGAGRGDLRKELNKALRDATKPLIADTRSATSRLPQSGGLADIIRKTPQTVKVATGKNPGVRITVGGKGGAARTTEQGFVRHPVYGRGGFVRQSVPSGWFSEPLNEGADVVRPRLIDAIDAMADRIVREAK